MRNTGDLKLTLLGVVPTLTDATGSLDPQSIAALSSQLTFKGKSIQQLKEDALAKDKPFTEQIQKTLQNSSLKGHASISTTPVISFTYEASKFIDSLFTGLPFASALMHSGRRANIDPEDIVVPTGISEKPEMERLYLEESTKIINFFNEILQSGLPKDYASKILPYGNYGTGIITLSVESLLAIKREYELEKDWMPEEVGLFFKAFEPHLKELGLDILYATRFVSPASIYAYPNIFKNPDYTNEARIYKEKHAPKGLTKLISASGEKLEELQNALGAIDGKLHEIVQTQEKLTSEWFSLLLEKQRVMRDFGLSAEVKILSTVSWRVWGDKKRHRTVPMVVDSLYHAINRTSKTVLSFEQSIYSGIITDDMVKEIDLVCAVPDLVRSQKELLMAWLQHIVSVFKTYEKLIAGGIKPRDAVYVIPRGIRIDVLQQYNLHNLISGYYPLRLCSTAEEQLQKLSLIEAAEIKKALKNEGLDVLADMIRPKCQLLGFCPEKKNCAMVQKLNPAYDEAWHEAIHKNLEERYVYAQTKLTE